MADRTFRVRFEGEAVIALGDDVISHVNDEWRSSFYKLYSPEKIAEHIAYNLVVNRARLGMLDGWADLPDSSAQIVEEPEWEVLAVEEKRVGAG